MTPVERARAAQLLASDPLVSAFVAASAGSGKTKLLTDRLLRLLLAGADAQRIVCLTFTKAAAAEMALRLQRRLGAWVTLPDAQLDADLRDLAVVPSEETRTAARALFARVLDLPGGMRIGTIHAFCQSLLRRFPLEARLSPHFELVDERDAAIALQQAREAMLAGSHTEERRAALQRLAGLATLDGFGDLVATLRGEQARLDELDALGPAQRLAILRRVLDARPAADRTEAVTGMDEAALRALFDRASRDGSKGVKARALSALDFLGRNAGARMSSWPDWHELFFSKSGPRALSTFVNDKLAASLPGWEDEIAAEQHRLETVLDAWRAEEVALASEALLSLALPVAKTYDSDKRHRARLDYDDLIARTTGLLVDPGAAWVLYKLDGGLDHVLLDEVQDTAPDQWDIAGALTADFFAGQGARDAAGRTVFAVGDRKQSIYGFQGADPDGFEHWRAILRERVTAGGAGWKDVSLDVSFRSTTPVLALVDAVFADQGAAAGVCEPGTLRHVPKRAGQAGTVELWPLTPQADDDTSDAWTIPDENRRRATAPQRLADTLADWIAQGIAGGITLPSHDRTLRAGDVLVLVRRRDAISRLLLRALKTRGVPVAGLDRMVLTEQPAVADLMALCDALLLPQDDLQLACVLTSPLGGLSDDELMALAAPRSGTLWDALRNAEAPPCRAAWDFLHTLFRRVDHASPHALLAEALGPLGGRARLLARLGPEAAEPIDELLSAALRHAQGHPPSLQHFLHWLRQSAAEVKREADSPAGSGFDAVRIMTVHGAKGLQAPVVILPDTTALPPERDSVLWASDADSNTGRHVPVWTPRRELRCAKADTLRQEARRKRMEEYNRLLYVALTRAEDRLLICGVEGRKGVPEESWYAVAERGFARLGAAALPFDTVPDPWPGQRLQFDCPQTAPAEPERAESALAPVPLPGWAGAAPAWRPAPPPDEPALPHPLAPSRPEGVELGSVPEAASPLLQRDLDGRRFRRGQLVHALLQHLPNLPEPARRNAAIAWLARPGLDVPDPEPLADEVLAVLSHPGLAPVFGPDSRAEVPVTGVLHGQVIGGLIDRIAIRPDSVWIADYKTNRRPPRQIADTPVLYLRQMAAYRALLAAIHPNRPVRCALVWTAEARVDTLPDSLLDAHEPGSWAHA